MTSTVDLSIQLGSLTLRNPLMSASGTFGHGFELLETYVPATSLGALVLKTVTPKPRHGNPPPRIRETASGMINSIGLENKGVEAFTRDTLPKLLEVDVPVVVNIGGESVEEFRFMAERMAAFDGVAALEVNLSCPNVQGGRLPFATDPQAAAEVITAVKACARQQVFAKLSPNVTRIDVIAAAVEAAGADAITAINTVLGLAVDWRTRKPAVATVLGGLSGPAIKPMALRMVRECAHAVSIPVIGCGGIRSADDVLEFLVAGATAVQVGTYNYVRPDGLAEIRDALERRCLEAGITRVRDLTGTLDESR